MAKKRSAAVKSPLEWVTDVINTSDATDTNGRIALRLDRDEVAEIKKVVVSMDFPNIDDAADDVISLNYCVSLDPDIVADPTLAATREDLEVFMIGDANGVGRVGAAGQTVYVTSMRHELNLPDDAPILAGSDIGWVVQGDATIAAGFTITIYLRRRKAKPGEKFNVLLSRR